MKHFFAAAVLASVAFLGIVPDSQAHGFNRRCSRGGCDSAPCAAPYATTAVPVQPVAPKYEERKVVRYKPVMVEKEIEVLECKRVLREEKYTYTVCVPVTKQEKRRVVVCEPVYKDVEYTYTVCVPVTVQEKRKEIVCTPTYKEVDRVWTEMVRSTVQKKVKVTTFECIRENIVETVPVCRTVRVNCVDECGRCYTRCERVTVMEQRTRCVVKRIPVEREVIVNEVVCTPVERKGKVQVCEMVRTERDVLVNVCKFDHQQKKGVKKVCEMVRVEKDVLVNVCSFEHQKREGVRTVCDVVTQKVKRKVMVCEMQQYEETVRVLVGGGAPCHTDCYSDCGHGGRRGIFRRGGGCCN